MTEALKYYKASTTECNTKCPPGGSVKDVTAVYTDFKLTENPGEPKVTQFDDLVFGDEDIFWLDVSMDALQEPKQIKITITCSGTVWCEMQRIERGLCEYQ